MAECQALAAWAEALPIVQPEPATQDQIETNIGHLAATLPARNVDTETGKSQLVVYTLALRGISSKALSYMAARVARERRWMPTPAECLEIAGEYRPPETERASTLRLCSAFAQDALERWLENVRDGQELGDVPDQWLRIGVEQGLVRRLADGSYVSRALYLGPRILPPSPETWHSEINKDRTAQEDL